MGTGLSALWGMDSCSKQRLAVDRHPGGVITHRHPEGVTPIYETWLFRALVELGSKEQDPETLRLSSSWRQVWGMGTGLSALWGMGSCSKQRLAVDRHPEGVTPKDPVMYRLELHILF